MDSEQSEDDVFEDTLAIFDSISYLADRAAGSAETDGAYICSAIADELFIVTKAIAASHDGGSSSQRLLRRYTKFFGKQDLSELADTSMVGTQTQKHVESMLERLVQDDRRLLRKAGQLYIHTRNASVDNGARIDVISRGSQGAVAMLESCHEEMRAVHRLLSQYTQCICVHGGEHLIRLKLHHKWSHTGLVKLDLVLSREPEDEKLITAWQDIGISVTRPDVETRTRARVHFGDDPPNTEVLASRNAPVKRFLERPLCRYLSAVGRLALSTSEDATSFMWSGDDEKPLQNVVPHPQSVSLAKLLDLHELQPYQKMAIAYILALAVWQCYTEEWLSSLWTSETVYFMYESDGHDLFASKPYISVQLRDQSVSEQIEPLKVSHRWTRVLALGLMLVEIGTGASYKAATTCTYQELTAMHTWACKKAQEKAPWPQFHYPDYRLAVQDCLDKNIFDDLEFIEDRRDILYKKIVSPLHRLMHTTKWHNDLDNSTLMKVQQRQVRLNSTEPVVQSTTSSKKARRWLTRFDELRESIIDKSRQLLAIGEGRRIKIAILDTGYDAENPFFQVGLRARRLCRWRDFVCESNTVPIDQDGHGTSMLSLIMRLTPEADLHVARVAYDKKDLINDNGRVAQALAWAQSENVDIISMSFGFQDESEATYSAINGCLNRGIVLLAAASNDGANQAEMFPASHRSVISIRSTDHEGCFQASNPSENSSTIAYGTLGVSVPCEGLSSEPHSLTGASVATALAVGVAGMLTHYAANSRLARNSHVQQSLCTYEGVTELFRIVSGPTITASPRYQYIAPWRLETMSLDEIDALFVAAMANVRRRTT